MCLAPAMQYRCNQFCSDITHTALFKPLQDAVGKIKEYLQHIERKLNQNNEKQITEILSHIILTKPVDGLWATSKQYLCPTLPNYLVTLQEYFVISRILST